MSVINGSCYLVHTLLSGDGAQGGAGVEVVEAEAQEAAAAELIHQQGLALLKHIWVQHGTQTRAACQKRTSGKDYTSDARGRQVTERVTAREKGQGDIHQCLTNPL